MSAGDDFGGGWEWLTDEPGRTGLKHPALGIVVSFPLDGTGAWLPELVRLVDRIRPKRRPGPHPGREVDLSGVLAAIHAAQAMTSRNPTQEEVAAILGYGHAASLSRAMKPFRWRTLVYLAIDVGLEDEEMAGRRGDASRQVRVVAGPGDEPMP